MRAIGDYVIERGHFLIWLDVQIQLCRAKAIANDPNRALELGGGQYGDGSI